MPGLCNRFVDFTSADSSLIISLNFDHHNEHDHDSDGCVNYASDDEYDYDQDNHNDHYDRVKTFNFDHDNEHDRCSVRGVNYASDDNYDQDNLMITLIVKSHLQSGSLQPIYVIICYRKCSLHNSTCIGYLISF